MNMTFRLIALAACLAFSACATSSKSTPSVAREEVLPFLGGQKVHRYEFKNGLRLLVLQDKTSPTIAYQTWFRVGSRDEDVKYTGLAHLFEHLMFKATKTMKDGEFDHILEAAGGEGMNASTSRDYTDYVQELPKDQLDLLARMESDRMVNLVVDDQQFKTEREVVQNERRYRNENSPDGLMYQEIYERAYSTHPYRWPVIGYEEDLNRMTAKDAAAFYKKHYAPNSATIVIVGDVEPAKALETVVKYYSGIPSVELKPNVRKAEPEQKATITKRMKLNTQVEKLMIGFKAPGFSHPDVPALMLVRSALANGKSSRLYKALVETGVASSVAAYDIDEEDPPPVEHFGEIAAEHGPDHRPCHRAEAPYRDRANLLRRGIEIIDDGLAHRHQEGAEKSLREPGRHHHRQRHRKSAQCRTDREAKHADTEQPRASESA
ncbi:MAG: insulinase family protein [Proteobacteria bacterium]|nr:MAG: insulinase family protein [Pseudomonadota bacterium]